MDENKVKVQLKPGVTGGEFHTTNFDIALKKGETAEVSEEQFQRLLLGTDIFEAVGSPSTSADNRRRSRVPADPPTGSDD